MHMVVAGAGAAKGVSFNAGTTSSATPAGDVPASSKAAIAGTSSYAYFNQKQPPPSPSSPGVRGVASSRAAAHSAAEKVHARKPREMRKMAEALLPVERDGLVENIYELLRAASGSGSTTRFTAFRVPETIVIRNGLIYNWFFTAKNGSVMRKNRSRLHRDDVRDALLKKGAGNVTNIVAVYLTSSSARVQAGVRPGSEDSPRPAQPPSPTTPGRPQDINTHTPLVHCDYLDAEQLRLFLDDDVLSRNGILQAFIEPSTDKMSTIEATFSPATTLVERRVNVNKMDDHRFPAVERMVTFDGADHYSDIVPVQRPQTVSALKDGCHAIKDHIAGVGPFYLDVGRMVLYLREDSKRQLWLLWCTSFRCTPRPDDPKTTNYGPLTLHTRMTVDRSGEEGSTRRREKLNGLGSTNLEEKTRVPTTGVVVIDPTDSKREWMPDVVTEKVSDEEAHRHLVYNIPTVGLLDVLFEPGGLASTATDGYWIKDRENDGDAKKKKAIERKDKEAGTGVSKISDSEKHRSTRLTKGMELASGELYEDALLICQTAPDLESLKSATQRESERSAAAQTLWSVVDEKAREREAVRDRMLTEAQALKREKMKTYNVRILKRHRGVDGVHVDVSLNLQDLAPPVSPEPKLGLDHILDNEAVSGSEEAAAVAQPEVPLAVELPGDQGNDDESPDGGNLDDTREAILKQLGYSETVSPRELPEDVKQQLEMLRGVPQNHPSMLEFIRQQRQRMLSGSHIVIETVDSDKKTAARKARNTRSAMGRTGMEMPSPKISKAQLVELTRRHTNKLPKRASPRRARPGSAPVTSSAAAALAKVGVSPAAVDPNTISAGAPKRVRPVSASVSASTAARWGVKAGTPMVDEAAAVQGIVQRHAEASNAVDEESGTRPPQQRPLWGYKNDASGASGAGGAKPLAQMRVRSADATKPGQQQRVPVPPSRPESAPSGRVAFGEVAERRKAAAEEKYRTLMGYSDKPVPARGKENAGQKARAAYGGQHRKIVSRPGSAAPASARTVRPASAMTAREAVGGGGGGIPVRPASARPISSVFGDSTARPDHHPPTATMQRRAQSARSRGGGSSGRSNTGGPAGGSGRPQSAIVPGRNASPRGTTTPNLQADTWLKSILAETQSLISSVQKEQELYTAEADKLEGQLWERAGANAAAYDHVSALARPS